VLNCMVHGCYESHSNTSHTHGVMIEKNLMSTDLMYNTLFVNTYIHTYIHTYHTYLSIYLRIHNDFKVQKSP